MAIVDPGDADRVVPGFDPEDPFGDDADVEVDAELQDFIVRSGVNSTAGRGREAVTALSALSQQMAAYKPLSVEEQAERVRLYNEGLEAAAKLASKARRSASTEVRLRSQLRAGEQAQIELIGSMFRLVMIIARELSSNRFGKDRSLAMLEELVADANLELVEALPRFDPARVPSFSAYAGRVVRDRIRSSLSNSAHIQVPSAWLRINAIATTRVPELIMDLGRPPTTAEIQEALLFRCMQWAADHLTESQQQLPEDERQSLMRAKLVKQGMIGAIERFEEVVQFTRAAVSLDAPRGDGDSGSFGETLEGRGSDATFDEVELRQLSEDIAKALSSLPERERDIILRRFGWVDGESWTYAKLAPLYDISAERVRQIEASVLSKLRGPGFSHLAEYLPATSGKYADEDEPAGPARRSGNFR